MSESTNVSLDHSHRLRAQAHTTPSSISAPSALPVISLGQTVAQDKEKRASRRERSHRFQTFQKTGKNLVADLSESRTSLRPDKKLGNPQGRYSCSTCKRHYAQPQGLTRHQLEKHNARLCLYCREFTWGRLYLFKKHLEMRHPGKDHNAAINEATRTHCRRRHLQQQRLQILTAEHDSLSNATCAESQARPGQFTLFPSAVAITTVFPLDMSSITYNLQPDTTEIASPSTEERVRLATNLDMSTRIRLVLCLPPATTLSIVSDLPTKVSDLPTTLSDFRTRGRLSARLPTVNRPWHPHLSPCPRYLLVDTGAARTLWVLWLSHLDTPIPVILRRPLC